MEKSPDFFKNKTNNCRIVRNHTKLGGYKKNCSRVYCVKVIVSNLSFLKLLRVKVGFSEKYASFMVESAGLFSRRPQKLEAVL